jgi:polysaccharide biosynthesis protein PelD
MTSQLNWIKFAKTPNWLSSGKAWLDTFILTLLLPSIGYAIDSTDPFYLNTKFPWLIFAPILISLRYGFRLGISNTCLLIAILVLGKSLSWHTIPYFPVEMIVGMLLATLMTAEFHELWQKKLHPLQRQHSHLKLRMEKFSRSYHILKGSHSKLEKQLSAYTKSMRTSLLELQKHVQSLEKQEGEPLNGIGEQILAIFSDYGNIQTASIYSVSEHKKVGLHPIAVLGHTPSLWPTNPLVRETLKTGSVTSVNINDEHHEQDIVVVIPLIDVYQKIWGVVVVHEMPLFALQDNTLDLFSLLGGHIGDLVQRRTETTLLTKTNWGELEYEVRRVFNDAHDTKNEAAVIMSITSNLNTYQSLMSKFRSELRDLDKVLSFKDDFSRHVIIKLLPLTNENGLNNFISRLDLMHTINFDALGSSDSEFSFSSLAENVEIHSWVLNDVQTPENLMSKIAHLCQNNSVSNQAGSYYSAEITA